MDALRSVLAFFGVEVEGEEKLKQVDTALDKAVAKVEKLAEAFAGFTIAKQVGGFIEDTIVMGAKIYDTSNRLGVATDDLQAFQYAAKSAGADVDVAAKSLQFLNRHVGLASEGNKAAAQDFAKLGVQVKDATGQVRPLNQLLPEVADAFEKMPNDALRSEYAVKLFSRAGYSLIPVLRGGSNGLRELYAEFQALGGGLQTDFIEKAKEVDRGLTRLSVGFDMMKSRIVLKLLPGLELGMAYVMKFFRYMQEFSDRTDTAKTALITLGAAGAVALAPLLIAAAPAIATFTALYYIFDDIFTMFEGGDSIIGRVIDALFGEGAHETFVKEAKEDAKKLWQQFKDALPSIKEVGSALRSAFEASRGPLEALFRTLGGLLELIRTTIEVAIKIPHALKSGDWESIGKIIDKGGDAIFGRGGILGKYITFQPSNNTLDYVPNGGLPILGQHARVGESTPGFIGPPPPPSVEIVNHNDTRVTVQGATTNEDTGRAVATATKDAQDASNRETHAAVKGLLGRTRR